ncbi:MAG: hypothetical protein WBL40_11260, partial [Terrimicrobiaceae bacterium]
AGSICFSFSHYVDVLTALSGTNKRCEGQIPLSPRGEFLLPPLGDWKIPLPLLRQELRRALP